MPISSPCRVGILGLGRFGSAFADLARDHGMLVTAYDPRTPGGDAPSLAAVVQSCEVLTLAVPVEGLADTLKLCAPLLRPEQLVIDVCSVKVEPERQLATLVGGRARWVASHPLFGPVSLSRGEPRTVIVCPRADATAITDDAVAFYRALGCDPITVSAEEHDRVMARTHVLAFFVARALQDIGASTAPFSPPSFKSMAHVVSLVREDAGHLFEAIQKGNPFAGEARRELIEALRRIDDELG